MTYRRLLLLALLLLIMHRLLLLLLMNSRRGTTNAYAHAMLRRGRHCGAWTRGRRGHCVLSLSLGLHLLLGLRLLPRLCLAL